MLHWLSDDDHLEPVRAALAGRSVVKVAYHRADLTDLSAVDRLMQAVHETFGGPDIVVNNAVVRHFAPVEELPIVYWQRSLAVNLTAPLRIIQLALPGMRKRDFGRIINLSRSEEHTSELQSLMRISYAVFC